MTDVDFEKIEKYITKELFNENLAAYAALKECLTEECSYFIQLCSSNFRCLQNFHSHLGKEKHHFFVFAYLFYGLNDLLISFRLLLLGYLPASGNLKRQYIESIAMAILCADNTIIPISRIEQETFKGNSALKTVLRHSKRLQVSSDSRSWLKALYESCHEQSHASQFGLVSILSFANDNSSMLYAVGSTFDSTKSNLFKDQANTCIQMAEIFQNVLNGILLILNHTHRK